MTETMDNLFREARIALKRLASNTSRHGKRAAHQDVRSAFKRILKLAKAEWPIERKKPKPRRKRPLYSDRGWPGQLLQNKMLSAGIKPNTKGYPRWAINLCDETTPVSVTELREAKRSIKTRRALLAIRALRRADDQEQKSVMRFM